MTTTEYTLTSADVASLLSVTDETVRRWAVEGKLSCVTLPSGHRRFRRADVEPFMSPDEPQAAAS